MMCSYTTCHLEAMFSLHWPTFPLHWYIKGGNTTSINSNIYEFEYSLYRNITKVSIIDHVLILHWMFFRRSICSAWKFCGRQIYYWRRNAILCVPTIKRLGKFKEILHHINSSYNDTFQHLTICNVHSKILIILLQF